MQWTAMVALTGLCVAACAPEVVRRPTQLASVAEGTGETIEILEDAHISVGAGYRRTISRGSTWTRVGRSSEGDVYKPVGGVFTVEGAHVHEAYLVLDGERLTGFYLPVERAFSPASNGSGTRLSFRRR